MLKFIVLAAAMSAALMAETANSITCTTTAQPPLVRAEGITERLGDIVLACAGNPGPEIQLDITVALTVDITNRINAQNQTDVVLSTDTGDGPVVSPTPGVLMSPNMIAFNGVEVPLSPSGTVTINISGIRGNASESASLTPFIRASLSIGGTSPLTLTESTVTVAQSTTGLYTSSSNALACDQSGSKGVSTLSFAAFIASNTVFAETRLTEGFAYAFAPKSDAQSIDADTGTRILVQYSGAPTTAALYVPEVIAGSDATEPTSAGAHGLPISGGKYTPGGNGSLLLSLVRGADSNGAGGTPLYTPSGSATVSFDTLAQVPMTNGAGYAVYEVMAAANNVRETALFPTFVTFPPILTGQSYNILQQISLAPVSNVVEASQTAPIPRFTGAAAPSDCPIIGDCTAPPQPAIANVTNSASNVAGSVVAGSVATVTGSNLSGSSTTVTFNGTPAQMLYQGPGQINLIVPAALAGQASARMAVGVDGQTVSQMVPLASFSPAIFPGAVLNHDNTLNSAARPAKVGTTVQAWGTGLTANGVVTAMIGNRVVTPSWWGEAPGIAGVQQINIPVPADLAFTGTAVSFTVCEANAAAPGQPVCGPARTLDVAQ